MRLTISDFKFVLFPLACIFMATPAFAETNVAIGPKLSTLGVGVEAVVGDESLAFRFGVNGLQYSENVHSSGVKWHGRLRLLTVGGFLDYHPFSNGFRLSLGPVYNGNHLKVSATPSQSITINNHTYTATQVGTAQGELKFHKIAPYLGIGYDAALSSEGHLSFNTEAGVLFQGAPKGSISATGLLANNAQMLSDLKSNAEKSANKAWIRYYPVISIGIKYRF